MSSDVQHEVSELDFGVPLGNEFYKESEVEIPVSTSEGEPTD